MRWGFVCIALLGCADDRSALNGRFVDRLYTPDGVVEHPTDLSTRAFRVYSNGRWYPEKGLVTGAFDGTVYIPDVPDGPYLLNVVYLGGLMHWYQREDHDFVDVTVRTGRPDALPATNVPMQLQLDNLAAWGQTDELYADCFENGTEHYPLVLDTPLSDGATQLRGTFDWASTFSSLDPRNTYATAFLLDGNAGDTLTVSRVAPVSRPGFAVSRLTQIARGAASTQRNGEPSSFTGTFVDVPPTITQRFSVDVPAIAAQLPGVPEWTVALRKSPSSVALDRFGPWLIAVSGLQPATEPITFSEAYGDPFDDSWQLVASGAYAFPLDPPVLSDGRRVNYSWSHYASEQRHLEPGSEFAFGPTLDFIKSASLDGHALAGDVPWDGQSPLSLHVDVPAGEAGFIADVLWIPTGETYTELLTTLRSQTADVSLPADVFALGADYMLRVAVTKESETSRSIAYTLLGPFRLVR